MAFLCGMESERAEGPVGAGRCGERTERCQWQRKRSERVAAVKILSARRKAAQKFWAPQQGHRPLRKRCKECDAVRNPPGTASPCQPPLDKGAMGTGVRIATGALRPRNDRVFTGSTGKCPAGGQGRPPLRCCVTKKSVGEGLSCPPSCQPTDGHCRTRQSGHFLETGSLHPPLAALRRFPLPRAG